MVLHTDNNESKVISLSSRIQTCSYLHPESPHPDLLVERSIALTKTDLSRHIGSGIPNPLGILLESMLPTGCFSFNILKNIITFWSQTLTCQNLGCLRNFHLTEPNVEQFFFCCHHMTVVFVQLHSSNGFALSNKNLGNADTELSLL